jgi:hypothetical protein
MLTWSWKDSVRRTSIGIIFFIFLSGLVIPSYALFSTWQQKGYSSNWNSTYISSDGSIIAAVNPSGDYIYLSTDSGSTWNSVGPQKFWNTISGNRDGTFLVASDGNDLYHSSDLGATWSEIVGEGFSSLAVSDSGNEIIGAKSPGNRLYRSSNGGLTWFAFESIANWTDVAISGDGQTIYAVDGSPGYIYSGLLFQTTLNQIGTNAFWQSIDVSRDGSKIVAVTDSLINTSIDGGINFEPRIYSSNHPTSAFRSASISEDGTILGVGEGGGGIQISYDSGTTWNRYESTQEWRVSISGDGSRAVAVANPGNVYISNFANPGDNSSQSSSSTQVVIPEVTPSADVIFNLKNRKYLSKNNLKIKLRKTESFKRDSGDKFKYSIFGTSKKTCVIRGNYVMAKKKTGVCEMWVTRTTNKGVKYKYWVQINYTK